MNLYRSLFIGATTLLGGCLMTATVPDLGTVTEARPFVLRDAVDPRPERILTAFPDQFLVPVAVNGPTSTFQWRVYVDLDRKAASASSGALFDIGQTSEAEPLSADAIRINGAVELDVAILRGAKLRRSALSVDVARGRSAGYRELARCFRSGRLRRCFA